MARMLDEWEMAQRRRQNEAAKKEHLERSVRVYGDTLGTAYHQYIYDDKTRTNFFKIIAQIVENGSTIEKALAFSAISEACEQRTRKLIQEAVASINPVY